jgi:MYXO-CTERM domain-containing protein
MDTLAQLQAMGLTLPSPAYIWGAVLFGLLGYAAWRRGRMLGRPSLT